MNVNKLALKMAQTLLKAGEKMAKSSVDFNITEASSSAIRLFLDSYYPNIKKVMLDSKYNVIPWDNWQEIIKWDLTDLRKYVKEKHDCDDFAYMFKYGVLRTFDIPCMIVHGHCYDENGKWLFGHFWNAMVANGKLYFYEPMSDNWVEVKKGQKIWIQKGTTSEKREYRPLTIEY